VVRSCQALTGKQIQVHLLEFSQIVQNFRTHASNLRPTLGWVGPFNILADGSVRSLQQDVPAISKRPRNCTPGPLTSPPSFEGLSRSRIVPRNLGNIDGPINSMPITVTPDTKTPSYRTSEPLVPVSRAYVLSTATLLCSIINESRWSCPAAMPAASQPDAPAPHPIRTPLPVVPMILARVSLYLL